MPLAIVLLVIKGLAIVHVFRTGREWWWVAVILFLPVIGVLMYLLVEVLPSWSRSLTGRRAMGRVRSAVDPEHDIRDAALEYQRNPSVATASRLADELAAAGRHDEAVRIAEDALHGLFEDDPKLLLSLASAQFGAGRHRESISAFQRLRARHPEFRTPDGHLLLARALEECGETEDALREYAAVVAYYPGAEARVRQAMLYEKLGQTVQAERLFAAVLEDARFAPRHVRKSQREWLELAEREHARATLRTPRATSR